jgi:hypothetical protein
MSEIRNVQTESHPAEPLSAPILFHYVHPQSEHRRQNSQNLHIEIPKHKPSSQVVEVSRRKDTEAEDENEKEKGPGLFARLKSCARMRKHAPSSTAAQPKKKRWAILIGIILLLIVIGCIALATQLTRRGDRTPTQQQWLNLTGYPPMPTGISTIVRPDLAKQENQCTSPETMWSCSLPKEIQNEVAPNNPDQPNFRFEIKFRNGTVPSNMTIPINDGKIVPSKRANDPFTNDFFTPNPSPPARADQLFLGNTTDNITEPFDGEKTPFFMTFIPAFPINPNDPSFNSSLSDSLTSRSIPEILEPRQITNLSSAIPAPDTLDDGSAAPANLLPTSPFPFSQPIRLYNRGLQDEHYGFYLYFDKSIFLTDTTPLGIESNTTTTSSDTLANDSSGGSLRSSARARCTFTQTRFLVRFYTNPAFPATLLNGGAGARNTSINSAINYTPPGSFPYPASISIDRHGGNINKKLVYCYGVDELQVINADVKSIVVEKRGVGGPGLVNPAPGLVQFEGQQESFDENAGGIDGGIGGCECSWQNWR